MKLQRCQLHDGSKGWTFKTNDHTFVIEPRYAPNAPNYRGYIVFHTGPRPELKRMRMNDGVPLDDYQLQLKAEPIATLKLVKSQIELLLKAMNDANNQS